MCGSARRTTIQKQNKTNLNNNKPWLEKQLYKKKKITVRTYYLDSTGVCVTLIYVWSWRGQDVRSDTWNIYSPSLYVCVQGEIDLSQYFLPRLHIYVGGISLVNIGLNQTLNL